MNPASRTQELLTRLAGRQHHALDLGRGRVLLVVGRDAAREPQGQLLAHFAANLLARLFPVVQSLDTLIVHDGGLVTFLPRWKGRTLREAVENLFEGLPSTMVLRATARVPSDLDYDCIVAVGHPDVTSSNLFLGSQGWIAEVSSASPLAVRGSVNPIGAYAAACIGVAQVWNLLLYPYRSQFSSLPLFPLRGTLTLSCLDYSHGGNGPNPSLPEQVSVGRMTIVGLGAGGGASAYALASVNGLHGAITLIEPDEITDTGLNRTVAACESDVVAARKKAHLYSDVLGTHVGVTVRPLPHAFDDALPELNVEDLEQVVAAVHSRAARKAIQYETPRVLWDAAATETGEFYVWRVLFGQSQCLACRFADDRRDPEQEKSLQLTMMLGLSKATWLRKLRNNESFTEEEIDSIRLFTGSARTTFDLPCTGQRFGDWEVEQCGRLMLPDVDDEIPIPFAPVLAGVLTAGEVIKHQVFPEFALDSCYWNTLVGRFMYRNRPVRRSPRPDCPICQNAAFITQYEHLWGKGAGALGAPTDNSTNGRQT